MEFAGRAPIIEPVMDPFNSWLTPMKKPKPKSQTTTIHTNGQTIRITKNNAEKQKHKKKHSSYVEYRDPFLDLIGG